MAVRANFYGGPLNEEWRAMQEPVSAFRVTVHGMTGIYQATYSKEIYTGVWSVDYVWRGYDMQEVQESEGGGIE